MQGFTSIRFRDHPLVKVEKVIEASEFDCLEDLRKLVPDFGSSVVFVTPGAWSKYESMLFPPEELSELMEKK